MDKLSPIKFLVLDTPENTAEEFLKVLVEHNLPLNSFRVQDKAGVFEKLKDKDWDFLLINEQVKDIDVGDCVSFIHQMNKACGIAVLAQNEIDISSVTRLFEKGVNAVVSLSSIEYSIQSIKIACNAIRDKKNNVALSLDNQELKERCQSLLSSSTDAVAYIHEGMHVYANDSYIKKFGYQDMEDVLCTPFMDMVSPLYTQKLKDKLRLIKDGREKIEEGENDYSIEVDGLCDDGVEFNAQLLIKPTFYEGEECLQILVSTEKADQNTQNKVTNRDPETGLFSRQFFLGQLGNHINLVRHGKANGGLLIYIQLKVRSEENLDQKEKDFLIDLAGRIGQQTGKKDMLARLSESSFIALVDLGDGTAASNTESDWFDKLISLKTVEATASDRSEEGAFDFSFLQINREMESAKEVLSVVYTLPFATKPSPVQPIATLVEKTASLDDQSDDQEETKTTFTKEHINNALIKNLVAIMCRPVIAVEDVEAEFFEVIPRLYEKDSTFHEGREFMSFLDKGTGLKVDKWAMEKSLRVMVDLYNQGQTLQFFFSITAGSLCDRKFPQWLGKIVSDSGLQADTLVINCSEKDLLQDPDESLEQLASLKNLGFKLCISEFSENEELLKMIRKQKVDLVKLSSDLSVGAQSNEPLFKKMENVISELHSLGMRVIADDVESNTVLSRFYTARVDLVCGTYFQKETYELNVDLFTEKMVV